MLVGGAYTTAFRARRIANIIYVKIEDVHYACMRCKLGLHKNALQATNDKRCKKLEQSHISSRIKIKIAEILRKENIGLYDPHSRSIRRMWTCGLQQWA
jgi:hypothetical protein